MKFGAPAWLIGLPLVVAALLGLWFWTGRQARRLLEAAFHTPLLPRLLRSVHRRRRLAKRVLLVLGGTALLVALARPQWGRRELELERSGVDLIVALDVSRSMLAADAGGTNRLAAAARAIRRLLDELGGDRVALVVFAGEAHLAAPLTRDHTAIDRALRAADPATVSEQGSNLGEAIRRAWESFDRASQGPRALLVVSDGEQLQGDVLEATRTAAAAGIRVHTAGVGSATGAPIPARSGPGSGLARTALGRDVVSRADELRLQHIAAAGGGLYTRLTGPDSSALRKRFSQAAAALPRTTEKRMVDEPRERFQWPLLAALALLAAEWLLSERRSSRGRSFP